MRILSIGNSFSQNAQRYIHKISVLNGKPIKTVNLYIGGCSLRRHYFNILENIKDYEFQFNGVPTGLRVTAKDVLMSDAWDYVTFQQASINSTDIDTFLPYILELSEYTKKYAPKAKQIIHQTWAYSDEIVKRNNRFNNPTEMLEEIKKSYKKAKDAINACGIIPAGDLISALIKNGISSPHSDGHHLNGGAGQLAVGLLWYSYFTGDNPNDVILPDTDLPVTENEINIIRKSVAEVLASK